MGINAEYMGTVTLRQYLVTHTYFRLQISFTKINHA